MIDLKLLEEATEQQFSRFAEYSDRHDLFSLFHDLLRQLIIHKPENPLLWMADYLGRRPGTN